MAVTSPDNIWTPDSGDDYALTVDLARTADDVQDALNAVRGEIADLPKVSHGVTSATTDSNGFLTVTHTLGVTPVTAVANISDNTASIGNILKVNSVDYGNSTTTQRFRIYRMDTSSPFGLNPVKISWVVYAG